MNNNKLRLPFNFIGNYSIEERIWQGATSTIYKGVSDDGKIVAIKILHPYRKEKHQIQMFIKEFKILKSLSHPNLLKVYKLGKIKNFYYMSMEYIEGENLRNFYNKNIEIFPDTILYILIKTGEVIEYIHSKRIIHNDIKPENVLVGKNLKDIKLVDFGCAEKMRFFRKKINYIGGTERYSPPERKDGIINFKSDIYSYGVMLEEYLFNYDFFEKIYHIVMLAKSEDINKRPSINDLLKELRKIYENRNNK
ncbi:MAG: serine/threonine protein kinase [Candidatus Omnitrophica bacterium]|nr:serine/threonine protein kinase [Candidatus Omnitrophota bacterium]